MMMNKETAVLTNGNLHSKNVRAYNSRKSIEAHSEPDQLTEAEMLLLKEIDGKIRGRKILDLGVGGGRTTGYISKLSDDYTGVDYSEEMIQLCRNNHPGFKIIRADAKNMSMFDDGQFDFILFSANGIDYNDHDDRIAIFREIKRILKKNGYLVFSAHNRSFKNFRLFSSPFCPLLVLARNTKMISDRLFNPPTRNPFRIMKRLIGLVYRTAERSFNHLKNVKYEYHAEDYSIVNDGMFDYTLMTYYITFQQQKQQLSVLGFKDPIKMYTSLGEEILSDDQDVSESVSIYYLTQKA